MPYLFVTMPNSPCWCNTKNETNITKSEISRAIVRYVTGFNTTWGDGDSQGNA